VHFQPTAVPTYDALIDRAVKIVGVSDDHDAVVRCEVAVQQQFASHVSAARSQQYYLDVTNPTANKGVVIERTSDYFNIPLEQIATLGERASSEHRDGTDGGPAQVAVSSGARANSDMAGAVADATDRQFKHPDALVISAEEEPAAESDRRPWLHHSPPRNA
jgi:haloacid dehalogenase-like hydrolase